MTLEPKDFERELNNTVGNYCCVTILLYSGKAEIIGDLQKKDDQYIISFSLSNVGRTVNCAVIKFNLEDVTSIYIEGKINSLTTRGVYVRLSC